MAHRCSIYRIRLRTLRKKDDWRLLGNIDEDRTSFYDALDPFLKNLDFKERIKFGNAAEAEEVTTLLYETDLMTADLDYRGALFEHRRYGEKGLLTKNGEQIAYDYDDHQDELLGALFYAPKPLTVGFVALHGSGHRSLRKGLERELSSYMREEFNLYVEMQPFMPYDMIASHINDGAGEVQFRKLAGQREVQGDLAAWATDGKEASALKITPLKGKKLRPRRLISYIEQRSAQLKAKALGQQEPQSADVDHDVDDTDDRKLIKFSDLATIDGQRYDEIIVPVRFGNRDRSVVISENGIDFSQAFAWQLDDVDPSDDPDGLALELRSLLQSVVTSDD